MFLMNEVPRTDGILQEYECPNPEWKAILLKYCCISALARDAEKTNIYTYLV